jgi:hypothetical protein
MTQPYVSVETFAASLNNRMLACRELHHLWVPWTVEVVHAGTTRARQIGGYVRTMKCRQCKSERQQILDSSGHVVGNSYRYSDGYLASNVERGGFSRDTFRLEAITRFVEQHAEAISHTGDEHAPARLRVVS